ncbi:hypothetical protein RW64_17330 [Geobacter sulfurreducens]|nr:hypothetical protein RW64_17330 [Geobacter sulfurreducens]
MPHQGEIIRNLIVKPLGLPVDQAAKTLGLGENTLAGLMEGRERITPDIAVRLAMATDTTVESWLLQQAQYDEAVKGMRGS